MPIREFFKRLKFRKDLRKLFALAEGFLDAVHDMAKKGQYEQALDSFEVWVLATFLITEIYYDLRHNKDFASNVLDDFHKLAAEWFFNMNLSSLQNKLPDERVESMYDHFMSLFYDTTKERYAEYRSLLRDNRGLLQFSEGHFYELGKHLLKGSAPMDGEARKLRIFGFGVAALDYMSQCYKCLKH
jgi:hypothetical protein